MKKFHLLVLSCRFTLSPKAHIRTGRQDMRHSKWLKISGLLVCPHLFWKFLVVSRDKTTRLWLITTNCCISLFNVCLYMSSNSSPHVLITLLFCKPLIPNSGLGWYINNNNNNNTRDKNLVLSHFSAERRQEEGRQDKGFTSIRTCACLVS